MCLVASRAGGPAPACWMCCLLCCCLTSACCAALLLLLPDRAPPNVRGSGKERGHGMRLDRCPKCNAVLKVRYESAATVQQQPSCSNTCCWCKHTTMSFLQASSSSCPMQAAAACIVPAQDDYRQQLVVASAAVSAVCISLVLPDLQIGGHHVRCSAREAARQLAKKPRRTVSAATCRMQKKQHIRLC